MKIKLKTYKELLNLQNQMKNEKHDFDDSLSDSDFYYGGEDEESLYGQEEEEDYDDDEEDRGRRFGGGDDEDPSDNDVLEHLASLIRQMIKIASIENYYVYTNKYDLSIQFVLNKTERFTKLMKVMGLLKKLSTDTLIQYEAEVDLWETKDGHPLLTVNFYYDSNKSGSYKKDDVPF
jgi:hypothetical protein